jgi:hypothetical protein
VNVGLVIQAHLFNMTTLLSYDTFKCLHIMQIILLYKSGKTHLILWVFVYMYVVMNMGRFLGKLNKMSIVNLNK